MTSLSTAGNSGEYLRSDLKWADSNWTEDDFELDLGPRLHAQFISVAITITVLVLAVAALIILQSS